jgi:UDP-2,4-diacetamido-2,4,6-trideoxy-beta-L-altropyranose hydrolase
MIGEIEFYWVFRVDSKPKSGGGHMMRSLALASVMSKFVKVHFVLDKNSKFWISKLREKGFSSEVCKDEGCITSNLLTKENCLGIMIDSYDINQDEMLLWSYWCNNLAMIDDKGLTPDFVNYIISPSIYSQVLSNNFNQVIMSGPKYALLSSKYQKNLVELSASKVNNIFLNFGYFDSNNYLKIALNALEEINFFGNVVIAIGSKAPYLNDLKEIISHFSFNVNLYEDLVGLYELNNEADMVIGSGGVGLLERMSLGKPSITIIASKNQEIQANWATSLGATFSFNLKKKSELDSMIEAVQMLINNKNIRENMSRIACNTIDGKGSIRVADALLKNKK